MDAARTALERENAALKAELMTPSRAKASEDMALITAQKLEIAKLQRRIYGQKSERSARLIDQLALGLEELEANATEDERRRNRRSPKQQRSPAPSANGRSSVIPFLSICRASEW